MPRRSSRPGRTRRARGSRVRAHRVGRGQHRLDDVVVAGATAEIALEPEPDLALGGMRVLVEEPDRRHHHARGAVAALQPVLLVERLLHGVERVGSGQPLDGGDRGAVGLGRQHRARLHRLAVDEHRARPTARRVAADLGAGDPALLAQELHEQRARLDVVGLRPAVHAHRDPHGRELLQTEPQPEPERSGVRQTWRTISASWPGLSQVMPIDATRLWRRMPSESITKVDRLTGIGPKPFKPYALITVLSVSARSGNGNSFALIHFSWESTSWGEMPRSTASTPSNSANWSRYWHICFVHPGVKSPG